MNYVEEMKNIFIHWMDEYDENEILSMYNPWGPAGLFNIENGIGKNVNDIIKAYVDYFSSAYTFQVDGDEDADFFGNTFVVRNFYRKSNKDTNR